MNNITGNNNTKFLYYLDSLEIQWPYSLDNVYIADTLLGMLVIKLVIIGKYTHHLNIG